LKVFSDLHHFGLYNSLLLFFEGRLGYEVYRPIGIEWWDQGFWAVYPHPATAAQYLSLDQEYKPKDGSLPLNQIIKAEEGVYLCNDISNKTTNKAITLEKFKEIKFDILLCSIPQHVPIWLKLKELYQPQAKLIFQVGNAWTFDNSFPIKNILASAKVPNVPNFNICEYHQEFDTKLYHPESPQRSGKIYSFVNCINTIDLYKQDWELFLELEKILTGFEFESYGGQTRGGALAPQAIVAQKTLEADIIYHVKNQGDGYSYGMHTAAACGRVIITRLADYKGKLAESLITPQTCLIIDGKTAEQIAVELVDIWTNRLEEMSQNMANKFKEVVNFDSEELKIRKFLDIMV